MAKAPERSKAPRPELGAGSLRVGRLTKPHGLKGGLKVEMYTDNPDLRFVQGAHFHLQVPSDSEWFGRQITLTELRWFNDMPVAFFDEVHDRTLAESIVRAILWIDEATVEAGAEDDAWYDHELVGLEVRRDGVTVGTVAEVQHFPAQDLLAVKTASGTVLVPLVEAIVPSIDLEQRVIIVTPPQGLFEATDLDDADPNVTDPQAADPEGVASEADHAPTDAPKE